MQTFFKKDTVAKILFIGYVLLFIWAGVNPYDRMTWWAENVPIMAIAISLIVLYFHKVRFSAASYIMMAVLIYLHTIGGHYTFERTPFGFVTDLFGFERNHYDRLAHFTVGFYAFPIIEFLMSRHLTKSKPLAFMFGVFAIAFVAMGYELIEWIFAATAGGSSGSNFLGSQGDIWDAQKDMLADTLGAITAASAYFLIRKKEKPLS